MTRPCQRAHLESGLKLDVNRLARRGIIQPGAVSGPVSIEWTDSYFEREIASGIITSDLRGPYEGHFRIQIGSLDQEIHMVPRKCHFGGHQWFFICPDTRRRAMVLWKPPGARYFCCRQRWGRQVAYASQFMTPVDRAQRGKAKINSRLCAIGGYDPDKWDLPPKPKWMRWSTYNRAEEKFDRYEEMLDRSEARATERLLARFGKYLCYQ
jgi:hypothetical protein